MKAFLFLFFISLTSFASEPKLIGKGLLEYSIFKIDVYEMSYFAGPGNREELHLLYKTGVKKKYSIQGWEVGLKPILSKNPKLKGAALWLIENAVDVIENDLLIVRKEGNKVTILKNGKPIANIEDQGVATLAFEPWLGEVPVDEDLKNKLLKNKSLLCSIKKNC